MSSKKTNNDKENHKTYTIYGISLTFWFMLIFLILVVIIVIIYTGKWTDIVKLTKHCINKKNKLDESNDKSSNEEEYDEEKEYEEYEDEEYEDEEKEYEDEEKENAMYSDDEKYIIKQSTIDIKPTKTKKRGKWKREEKCREILESIYYDEFPSCRPDFLKNPRTGRNLELDGYNEKLKLAFEHNGEHHYTFPNTFHKTIEDFDQQIFRDQYKTDMCKKLGIKLITIPYNIPFEEIRMYILSKLSLYT